MEPLPDGFHRVVSGELHPVTGETWLRAWRVDVDLSTAPSPGTHRDLTRQTRCDYLVRPIERFGPDHCSAFIARQIQHVQAAKADYLLDRAPFREYRQPIYDEGLFREHHQSRRVFLTFDGVSLWQMLAYERDAGADRVVFDLRRYAMMNFVTTDSLRGAFDFAKLISDLTLRQELVSYVGHVEDAVAARKWDLVATQAGNACDRVLLDLLLTKQASGIPLQSAKGKTDPRKWDLSDRIAELCRLQVIPAGGLLHHQLEVARALSNFRHAGVTTVQAFDPGPFDAMGAYAALRHLLEARASGKVS